jgi:hypothetical protein
MPKAYFVVRATVADPTERKAFDKWYQTEHICPTPQDRSA